MNTSIFIVNNQPVLRFGLRQFLGQKRGLTIIGESATGADALKQAEILKPDIIILDFCLPDINGAEVTRRILAKVPSVKVIFFCCDADRSMVDQALEAGACGYITKQSGQEEILEVIQTITGGGLYLSPEISTSILSEYRQRLQQGSVPVKPFLSGREKQLLRLVAAGLRNKEIADELRIHAKTVETYRWRLMKKVQCASTAELVRYAVREGIAAA